MSDWIENVVNKNILQDNLTFVSLYIAIYEHMVDYVVSNIKSFLCNFSIKNGKEFWEETDSYKNEIKNRIVDKKGNKNITKASFLWLVDNKAITQDDYQCFLTLKELRNKYAHNLTEVIYTGVSQAEIEQFFEMFNLYKKISKWYFINIEAPIIGGDLPENADLLQVRTAADVMFEIILDVLYRGKEKDYKVIIEKG